MIFRFFNNNFVLNTQFVVFYCQSHTYQIKLADSRTCYWKMCHHRNVHSKLFINFQLNVFELETNKYLHIITYLAGSFKYSISATLGCASQYMRFSSGNESLGYTFMGLLQFWSLFSILSTSCSVMLKMCPIWTDPAPSTLITSAILDLVVSFRVSCIIPAADSFKLLRYCGYKIIYN